MVGNQLRVAAYQSPLAHPAPAEALDLLRPQIARSLWVVRADVAGHDGAFVSYGSSAITDPQGRLICASTTFSEDLLIAEIAIPSGTERKS